MNKNRRIRADWAHAVAGLSMVIVLAAITFAACAGCTEAVLRTASGLHAAPRPDAPLSQTEVFGRLARAAVMVVVAGSGRGSGTVVGDVEGKPAILTVAHLFPKETVRGQMVLVAVDPGHGSTGSVAPAEVYMVDYERDLALVRLLIPLPRQALPVARVAPALYETLYMLAFPQNAPHTAGTAILSATDRKHDDDPPVDQMTGFCWPGSSGGTVANAAGELVGVIQEVNMADDVVVPEVCFFAPLASVRAFLSKVSL